MTDKTKLTVAELPKRMVKGVNESPFIVLWAGLVILATLLMVDLNIQTFGFLLLFIAACWAVGAVVTKMDEWEN